MKFFVAVLIFTFIFISCVSECDEQAYTITIYNKTGTQEIYCAGTRVPYFTERYPDGTLIVVDCAGDILCTLSPGTQYIIKPTK
jgi:hypothetical protein